MNDQTDTYKDVFAHFGLTAYHAQCFEMELKNLILLCVRANNKTMPISILEQCESLLDKQTLGRLVGDIRKIVDFSDRCVSILKTALLQRNQLMHGFFERNAQNFLSHSGREAMIDEFTECTKSFEIADTVVAAVTKAICKTIGITDTMVDAEFEKIRKAAEQAAPERRL